MNRPPVANFIKKDDSYYTFVVGVAKRARDIAEQSEDNHIILDKKPVKIAIEEFGAGKCKLRMVEHKEEELPEEETASEAETETEAEAEEETVEEVVD